MFQVSHLSSACLLIKTDNCNILCDPVRRNPHYDGWLLYPQLSVSSFLHYPLHLIYVSHIHEDHFDPEFLIDLITFNRSTFNVDTKIIIANRDNNFLAHKLNSYSIDFIHPDSILEFHGVRISVIPYSTGNPLDLDSVLLLEFQGHFFLNLNDIIYDNLAILELYNLINCQHIDLLAISYAGAGPFPHCYHNPLDLPSVHLDKVQYNKDKYLKIINLFDPSIVLPFAGEHFLTGNRYHLNPYRGFYDRLETIELDHRSTPLSTFGSNFIDLTSGEVHGRQFVPDSETADFKTYSCLAMTLTPSFTSFNRSTPLNSLLSTATQSFYKRISRTGVNSLPYTFNFIDSSSNLFATLNISSAVPCSNYSDIFLDPDLFCDLLARDKHWDNIFGGSLVDIRRYGDSSLGYLSEPLLAFFHI